MKYEVLKWIRGADAATLADIAVRMASHDEALFLRAVEESGTSFETRTYIVAGMARTINAKQLNELIAVGNGPDKKVATIKVARELLDLGLKDAKDLVEHLMEEGTLAKMRRPPEPYVRSWDRDTDYDAEQRGVSLGTLLREQIDSDRQTY